MSKAKLFAGILERTIDLRPRSRAESRRWTTLCHHQGRYIFWDTNICKISEFVKQQYLPNINLGELQIFVFYKYFNYINISYPWISFYFSQAWSNKVDIHRVWKYRQRHQHQVNLITNSRKQFLQNIFSCKSFSHQISSKYMFLQNHSIVKFLQNICSSKILL